MLKGGIYYGSDVVPDEHKQEIVQEVMDFVRIPSISNDAEEVGRALKYA